MPDAIFGPYLVGSGNYLYADPFRIRRLLAHILPAERANQLLDDWSPQAAEQFLEGVRVAFGIAPFDPATGQGATEDDVVQVWNAWQSWCEKKNQIAGTTQTSPTASLEPTLPPWARKPGSVS